jgi:hypothetical protein
MFIFTLIVSCGAETIYKELRCDVVLIPRRFSPDIASKRGLTTAEVTAVEAIHRAVEFNPHVPKVTHLLFIDLTSVSPCMNLLTSFINCSF